MSKRETISPLVVLVDGPFGDADVKTAAGFLEELDAIQASVRQV